MSETSSRTPSSLGPRIISAVVLAPVVLALVYAGGWPYVALLGLMILILASEWSRMVGQRPVWLLLGVLYIALTCWALWRLRLDPEWGRMTLFWLLAVVWGADTGGYVFGMTFKGPKLAPSISPNKTWSGFLGGTMTSALGGWAVVTYMRGDAGLGIALFSAAIGVASQAGDLLESWIKRRFGVKDSGSIIPGHGGLFDRVDGLVAAALASALVNLNDKGNLLLWL